MLGLYGDECLQVVVRNHYGFNECSRNVHKKTFTTMSPRSGAEDIHGIRYMRVFGDGDSSVMCDIQQYVHEN